MKKTIIVNVTNEIHESQRRLAILFVLKSRRLTRPINASTHPNLNVD